jgi:hypothetical protein
MGYETVFFIIILSVFIGYVSWIWAKYGVLPSISESYYRLPRKLTPMFTLFCWGFSFPAIILGSSGLMFFAGSGIAFVGAAAAFKEKMTASVHIGGALIGVLLSQLAIGIQYQMWGINIAFLAIAVPLTLTRFIKKKDGAEICPNRTWWIELAAFTSICIALGLNLFIEKVAQAIVG